MKRYIAKILVLTIIIIIVYYGLGFIESLFVDTKYAIKYGEIFGSYDIIAVDEFLDKTTKITYRGNTKTYQELRHNIDSAFKKGKFTMSSYGHSNELPFIGIQKIGVQSYVEMENIGSIEVYVEMELSRKLFSGYSIQSLSSSDEFFGYLFFGLPMVD